MYILLAILAGAVLGAGAEMLLAHREFRGVLVSGAIGAATAAVIYTVLTWSGVAESTIWMWVASIGGALVVSVAATIALSQARAAHDRDERRRLGI